eukprot:TRINITY_DN11342_c0_g1_i1.p1 TRINITY_DN11342_c0_g1~~TRINITY_DN11342_c0_g1_i1.p1  ORF type:complete len:201 (+),score=64.10 TRINITY_DN11342_c0_g1_i1:92-604(+)
MGRVPVFAQVLVVRGGRILLGRWRHGELAGRITGPLAQVPDTADPDAFARHVCSRVAGVDVVGPLECRGVFSFRDDTPGSAPGSLPGELREHEYFAADCSARGCEPLPQTEHMAPAWYPLESIPYGEMPEDDAVWYPPCLKGRRLSGDFVFRGQRLVSASFRDEGDVQPA